MGKRKERPDAIGKVADKILTFRIEDVTHFSKKVFKNLIQPFFDILRI